MMVRTGLLCSLLLMTAATRFAHAQDHYTAPGGTVRVALAKQPFSPNGRSAGPERMATGGIQQSLIGFATIPMQDEGGLSIAALNRMIEGAVRGVKARARAR